MTRHKNGTSRDDIRPAGHTADRLAAEIRQLITTTDRTLTSLGGKIGCSKQALSAYQNGERPPPRNILLALAREAGAPGRADELLALLDAVYRDRHERPTRPPAARPRRLIPAAALLCAGIGIGVLIAGLLPGGPGADGPPGGNGGNDGTPITQVGGCDRYVVAARDLYLRNADIPNGRELTQGQRVQLHDRHPGNAKLVRITADDHRTGWVFGEYLAPACG